MDGNKAKAELKLKKGAEAAAKGQKITPEMIQGTTVTVGRREIPMAYDVRTQIQIDEEIGMDWDTLRDSINNLKKSVITKTIVKCIRILGNRGLVKDGKEPDLTDEWLLDHIVMKDMLAYRIALLGTLTAGWYMETDDSQDKEIDVGLLEIRKKNGNTD